MKAFKSMILTAFLVLLGILSGCSPDEKRPIVFADPGWDSVGSIMLWLSSLLKRSMDSRPEIALWLHAHHAGRPCTRRCRCQYGAVDG